jgi:hypothetical protein
MPSLRDIPASARCRPRRFLISWRGSHAAWECQTTSSKRSRHPYRRSQPQHSGRERGDEERLEHLIIEGITSDDVESGPAAALFVLIGADPRIDWLPTCGRGHLAQG